MVKKLIPRLIRKYDIANKIFQELGDVNSRYILFSIIKKPKSVQEISDEIKIPLSTVYKKLGNLIEVSLVTMNRGFVENGRVIKYYQSQIDQIHVKISKSEPVISLNRNPHLRK